MRYMRILALGLLITSAVSCTSWMTISDCPAAPPRPTIDIYEYNGYYCFDEDDYIRLMEYLQGMEEALE